MDYIFNLMTSLYGMTVTAMLCITLVVKGSKSNEMALFSTALVCSTFILLYGFRTIETGTDTFAYKSWFESINGTTSSRDFEPLFLLFGKTISCFTNDASIFFLIITTITIFFLIKAFKINNNLIAAPIAITMCFSFISGVELIVNGIRSGLALSFATYALIKFSNDSKNLYFFVAISIASMLHTSCVIFYLALIIIKIINEKNVKIVFYAYIIIFLIEHLRGFDFLFLKTTSIGIGSHITSRILAFKYQESDMFNGYVKYYFFTLTLIPYLLFRFNYFINKKLLIIHYIMLMPYLLIFSSPSSYRFSYISFYLMIYIITQSIMNTPSAAKRKGVYFMIITMIIITYTTKTTLPYSNILFSQL